MEKAPLCAGVQHYVCEVSTRLTWTLGPYMVCFCCGRIGCRVYDHAILAERYTMPLPSLLLTLLTTDGTHQYPIPANADTQNNINDVVQALAPLNASALPDRNLIKDVAEKGLYDVLYHIIEKEYEEEPQGNPPSADEAELNRTLNSAIGLALERAIRGASDREASREAADDDHFIITLRDELRKKIIAALTPK